MSSSWGLNFCGLNVALLSSTGHLAAQGVPTPRAGAAGIFHPWSGHHSLCLNFPVSGLGNTDSRNRLSVTLLQAQWQLLWASRNACPRGRVSGLNGLMQVKELSHDAMLVTRCSTTNEMMTLSPDFAASRPLGKIHQELREGLLGKMQILIQECWGSQRVCIPPSCQAMPYFPDHFPRGMKLGYYLISSASGTLKSDGQFLHIFLWMLWPLWSFLNFSK